MKFDPVSKSLYLTLMCSSCAAPVDHGPSGDESRTGPPEWQEVSLDDAPHARVLHTLTEFPVRGTVVLIGGQLGGQALPNGDVWEWDGDQWIELPSTLPLRKNHAAAYDAARRVLVVFGGIVGGLGAPSQTRGDTWEWDGETWSDRLSVSSPAPRAGHALAYDASRERVVLFGGIDSSSPFDDTWEWDGETWRDVTPGFRPPPRFNVRMVYDDARARIVLFGGFGLRGGEPLLHTDTWEWDGEAWVEVTPSDDGPAGRGFHSLAYDRERERVVLYGGAQHWPPFIREEDTLADHWEWDGTVWTLYANPAQPGKRGGAATAYDGHQAVVLFGGSADGTTLLSDTWRLSPQMHAK